MWENGFQWKQVLDPKASTIRLCLGILTCFMKKLMGATCFVGGGPLALPGSLVLGFLLALPKFPSSVSWGPGSFFDSLVSFLVILPRVPPFLGFPRRVPWEPQSLGSPVLFLPSFPGFPGLVSRVPRYCSLLGFLGFPGLVICLGSSGSPVLFLGFKQCQAMPSTAKHCQAMSSNARQGQAMPSIAKQCQAMSFLA